MKRVALGMLGRLNKKRFNVLLTACLPRASGVCAPRDTPALCSPPAPCQQVQIHFASFFLLFGEKVSPSLSQRQRSPILPQKRGPATPASALP